MKHEILSASENSLWTRCPASARLERLFKNEGNIYSNEGIMAHELLERCFKAHDDGDIMFTSVEFGSEEMKTYVLDYVSRVITMFDNIKQGCKFAHKFHRVKVDFSKYVPEGFGASDTVIIADDTMYVIDLIDKDELISAKENEQLILYGLGAYLRYAYVYDIERVELIIIQSRLNHYSTYTLSVDELLALGGDIKKSINKAFSGEVEAIPGKHCQFCKARALCKVKDRPLVVLTAYNIDFKLMNDEEILELYPLLDTTEKFINDLKEYMLMKSVNESKRWRGLKLVEGRSASKYVDDLVAGEAMVKAGIPEAMLYSKKLVGITDAKKLCKSYLRNENFLLEHGLIIKPIGSPILVYESDKRPELDNKLALLSKFEEAK